MFHKKGQVPTYKQRGRLWGVGLGIAAIWVWIMGIILVIKTSNWLIILAAVVITALVVIFFISNERRYRGEP